MGAGRVARSRSFPPMRVLPLAFVLLAGLSACSKPDNAPGPGGVTVGEARALDDAAAMIEDQPPPQVVATAIGPAAPTAAATQTAGGR